MLTAPMLPFLGSLIVELRNNTDLRALVNVRVRGRHPAPESPDSPGSGDVQSRGSYKNYVVLDILSAPPDPYLPVTFAEVGARCYGTNEEVAWAVWGALVAAVHDTEARVKASGLGIYKTKAVTGGTQENDPDNDQPFVTGSISVIATTQVVT